MKWYEIHALADQKAEIWIHGEIGWEISSQSFLAEMKALGDVKDISVRINSPGGYVFDGIAIYNMLREHPATVSVMVDGIAASAASIIAMAGDQIVMGPASMMMIHHASGLALGNGADMRKMADALDAVDSSITEAYVLKSGRPEAEITALMDGETWMTAKRAVDEGLADSISAAVEPAPVDATAYLDIAHKLYARVPAWAERRIAAMAKPPLPPITPTPQKEPIAMTTESTAAPAAAPVAPAVDTNTILATERERVRAILALGTAHPGHDDLLTALVNDPTKTAGDAAIALLAAGPAKNSGHIDTLRRDLPGETRPAAPTASAETDASLDGLPVDEKCKRLWAKSADLQAEFGGEIDRFIAYEKASARGLIRKLDRPAA